MKTPQLPPLIIKKSPSAFYVYTYKNKWDPEKKRSYRASFKKVGTVTSGEKEGRIRWDDHFLAERPVYYISNLLHAFSHDLGGLQVTHALEIGQIKGLPIVRV